MEKRKKQWRKLDENQDLNHRSHFCHPSTDDPRVVEKDNTCLLEKLCSSNRAASPLLSMTRLGHMMTSSPQHTIDHPSTINLSHA